MSLVGKTTRAIQDKSVTIIPSQYVGDVDVQSNMNPSLPFFFGNDGIDYKFAYGGINSAMTAYRKCPPLTAVINRKAQAHINGRTIVTNTQGKEATSPAAKKLKTLLAKPNPLQSWKQFEAQQKIYMQLFGFCLVLPIIPAGYESYGPIEATSLWNIPPYMIDMQETSKLFYQTNPSGMIQYINLNYKGTVSSLKVDSVYFFKDFTPSFDTLIIPDSRVRALEMPINNIIGAYESKNVLINYRGALGILTPEPGNGQYVSIPLDPKDKEQLQSDFRRYGLKNSQWKFIISPAAMKWQQMGVPTKDLMLKEEIEDCTKAICDAYGYPPHLLGLIDPTFNNQNTAEKGLYQNTIIPEAESVYEEWNNMFRTAENNILLTKNYDHLPVLQEDRVEQGKARLYLNQALLIEWQNNLITANQWLETQGQPTVAGFDVYYDQWVKEGKTFGAQAAPPTDPNANNQNQNQNGNK